MCTLHKYLKKNLQNSKNYRLRKKMTILSNLLQRIA